MLHRITVALAGQSRSVLLLADYKCATKRQNFHELYKKWGGRRDDRLEQQE
jgi:hypothetical protein